jgi:hypothetical protein
VSYRQLWDGPCASGLYCKYDASRNPTTCAAPAGLNGACDSRQNGADCSAGLYCNGVYPGAGTCVAQKTSSQPCAGPYAGQCAAGLYCNGTPGTCAAQKAAGASCAIWQECAGVDMDCVGGICSVYGCY